MAGVGGYCNFCLVEKKGANIIMKKLILLLLIFIACASVPREREREQEREGKRMHIIQDYQTGKTDTVWVDVK